MNDKQLGEIETRCKKATSGPWFVQGPLSPEEAGVPNGVPCCVIHEIVPITHNEHIDIVYIAESCEDPLTLYGTNNAEFIAHAREDIPLLIAEMKKLKHENKTLKRLNKALESMNEALESMNEIYERQERKIEAELDEYGDYKG